MTSTRTFSDVVAERVREVRKKQGLTAAQLASLCADRGYPELTTQALSNIESGRRDKEGRRRRYVTADELMALAVVLEVAPVYLLIPPLPSEEQPLPDDAAERHTLARVWQSFIKGERPLPGMDPQRFLSEVPPEEFARSLQRLAEANDAEAAGKDHG
jgi:transcriptional regulator with XRE-family HTH domain